MGCYVGVNEVDGEEGRRSEVEPDAPEDDGFGAGIGGVGVGVMIGRLHLPGVGAGGGVERGLALLTARGALGIRLCAAKADFETGFLLKFSAHR